MLAKVIDDMYPGILGAGKVRALLQHPSAACVLLPNRMTPRTRFGLSKV